MSVGDSGVEASSVPCQGHKGGDKWAEGAHGPVAPQPSCGDGVRRWNAYMTRWSEGDDTGTMAQHHTAIGLLSIGEKGDCLLPHYSWPRVSETVESRTTDKG